VSSAAGANVAGRTALGSKNGGHHNSSNVEKHATFRLPSMHGAAGLVAKSLGMRVCVCVCVCVCVKLVYINTRWGSNDVSTKCSLVGRFPQKSPTISDSFAEIDPRDMAFYVSAPEDSHFAINTRTHTHVITPTHAHMHT